MFVTGGCSVIFTKCELHITSTGTDLLEKLTIPQLVKKLSPLYGTQKYMFTNSPLLALIPSQMNPFHTLAIFV
jgi:hypothetical protein